MAKTTKLCEVPANFTVFMAKNLNGCQFYNIFYGWQFFHQLAHPILRLLVVLSDLPEFASKLYSSVLLKTIFKLTVTSAVTVS